MRGNVFRSYGVLPTNVDGMTTDCPGRKAGAFSISYLEFALLNPSAVHCSSPSQNAATPNAEIRGFSRPGPRPAVELSSVTQSENVDECGTRFQLRSSFWRYGSS